MKQSYIEVSLNAARKRSISSVRPKTMADVSRLMYIVDAMRRPGDRSREAVQDELEAMLEVTDVNSLPTYVISLPPLEPADAQGYPCWEDNSGSVTKETYDELEAMLKEAK